MQNNSVGFILYLYGNLFLYFRRGLQQVLKIFSIWTRPVILVTLSIIFLGYTILTNTGPNTSWLRMLCCTARRARRHHQEDLGICSILLTAQNIMLILSFRLQHSNIFICRNNRKSTNLFLIRLRVHWAKTVKRFSL